MTKIQNPKPVYDLEEMNKKDFFIDSGKM